MAANVKAVRDFRNANIGARTAGERFEYDLDKDSEGLKKLGLVEPIGAAAEEKKGR